MNLFILRPVPQQVDEQPVELKVWTCIFIRTYARQLHPSILRLSVTKLSLPVGQALAVDVPTICTMVMPDEL